MSNAGFVVNLLVEVPRGESPHDGPGGSHMRVGASKRRMTSDERLRLARRRGQAGFDLHTTHLPMTVLAAAPGCAAHLEREWTPGRGALAVELDPLPEGGSVIFFEDAGTLPGLGGRLNPVRDTLDRTYLYASNVAINEGRPQPVTIVPGEDLRLTDAGGAELLVRIIDVVGRSALVEYRRPPARDGR